MGPHPHIYTASDLLHQWPPCLASFADRSSLGSMTGEGEVEDKLGWVKREGKGEKYWVTCLCLWVAWFEPS